MALKGFVKPVLDSLALPDHSQNPRQFLKTVTFLLSATTRCSTGLRGLFPDTARAVMSSLTHPLFQPFERFVAKYAELDGAVLSEEVRLPVSKLPLTAVKGHPCTGTTPAFAYFMCIQVREVSDTGLSCCLPLCPCGWQHQEGHCRTGH